MGLPLLMAATYHMTEYCPLIGAQYPVRRGQHLNTQFNRPFPPCGSGLAGETTLFPVGLLRAWECSWLL